MGDVGGEQAFILQRRRQASDQLVKRRDDGFNFNRRTVNVDRRQVIGRAGFQLFLQVGKRAGDAPDGLIADQQRQADHKHGGNDQAGDRFANLMPDVPIVIPVLQQRLLEKLNLLGALVP